MENSTGINTHIAKASRYNPNILKKIDRANYPRVALIPALTKAILDQILNYLEGS